MTSTNDQITDHLIPGFGGFDPEGLPLWERDELDEALSAFLSDVQASAGFYAAGAFEEALHFLTSKADPNNDGTVHRERFVTFLVRLADREQARAEALRRAAAGEVVR
ncbi:hypothetical protein [Actinomarinicola tropica]|uniref:EF-hand domain-containing protein n=1 Tax=Actinomarinicola tropica TaxID=2789776 RepID=A0A5Q2RFK2_9ACTN|nr:hypothetical protein [Actinomarinicola tropica]QGG95609.1 hypothetical protein GH723_11160 [Actinomarinicola tropica]